jgi:hypothetical protein
MRAGEEGINSPKTESSEISIIKTIFYIASRRMKKNCGTCEQLFGNPIS